MSGMSDANPFKKSEIGLWARLVANTDFATIVPVGNRIKHCDTNDPDPPKDNKLDGDLPQVEIVPAGYQLSMRGSNASEITQRFNIEVLTGDQRTTWNYSDLKWAILRVCFKLFGESMDSLSTEWEMPTGTRIIKVVPGPATDELAAQQGSRLGWFCVQPIDISFQVNEAAVSA